MDKMEKSLYLTQREHKEVFSQDDPRTNFVHDRDRIIHSKAFRRLMHKTQIFNANKGDHFRNRLTHTLEVAQIARSIGRRMNLNEDLIEAIALGHDLGHTPFGHIGERKLGELMHEGLKGVFDGSQFSFKHNFQSVRVVEYIENKCDEFPGINLTLAVREGMIKHTKLQTKDIFDVAKASESKLEAYEKKHGIPSFDSELSVYEENCIGFSEKVKLQADDLAKKRDNWIIFSKEISQADSKAEYFITQIFKA